MAKSPSVTVNAKAVTDKLSKLGLKINKDIMQGLADTVDLTNVQVGRNFVNMPTGKVHPTKLARRTYTLQNVFRHASTWKISKNKSTFKGSKYLNYWIRPQIQGGKVRYLVNLAMMPRSEDKMKFRFFNEDGRGKTKGGHRRKARPFFEPGIRKGFKGIDRLLLRQLRKDYNRVI